MTITLDQINAYIAGESIRAFIEEYEFRDPDYTPSDADKAMLEDAICGFVAKLDPVFTLAKQALEEAWQPIETAPKDGAPLALWVDDGEIVPYWFSPVSICENGSWWDDSTGDQIEPIKGAKFWARLPTPPGGVE